MYERIDHVSISIYQATLHHRNSLWSRYTASKDIMIRQVLRLPLVSFIADSKYSAVLISVLQLSRTLSRHH